MHGTGDRVQRTGKQKLNPDLRTLYFEKGSIVIVVLWSLFFLSALAIAINAHIRPQLDLAEKLIGRTKMYYLARAGVKRAILEVKNDKTDAIFFVGLVKQFVGVLKEANELGIKKKFFSQWSVEDQQLLDGANDLAEGIIYTYPFDYDTPYSKDFTFKYQQKYNKVPNGYVAESYVGTMLIGEAINVCQNKINVNCWKDYLDKIKNFPTIMGLVTMDSRGDIKAGKVFLKTVKDGKFVKLEE